MCFVFTANKFGCSIAMCLHFAILVIFMLKYHFTSNDTNIIHKEMETYESNRMYHCVTHAFLLGTISIILCLVSFAIRLALHENGGKQEYHGYSDIHQCTITWFDFWRYFSYIPLLITVIFTLFCLLWLIYKLVCGNGNYNHSTRDNNTNAKEHETPNNSYMHLTDIGEFDSSKLNLL